MAVWSVPKLGTKLLEFLGTVLGVTTKNHRITDQFFGR